MKRSRILSLALALSLTLGACQLPGTNQLNKYSKTIFDYFDTVTTVIGYAKTEEEFNEIADFVTAELEHYDSLYDNYNAISTEHNLYYINEHASEGPVEVNADVISLFQDGKDVYELTGGKTNFAMGAVLELWHDAREEADFAPEKAALPEMDALQEAAQHCNIEDVVIDEENSTIYYADPELKCDVGAIAKGYAIERIIADLEEKGVNNFILNAGGNVRTIGTKPDGSKWTVAIQNPDLDAETNYVETLSIADQALTTSGSYQRYMTVDGVRYHHIIDPETLYPDNTFLSVSILNSSATIGDALSTALFNMSLEDGRALIESMDDTEAMWILADESKEYSSGFEAYIKK